MRRDEIERFLPAVYQLALHPFAVADEPETPDAPRTIGPDPLLGALLDTMEMLHAPVEDVLANLDRYIDPERAPARFVPFLAGWLDLDWLLVASPDEPSPAAPLLATGLDRLRALVTRAADLTRREATPAGLVDFLETATGVEGFAIHEDVTGQDEQPKPFHLRVLAPVAARPFAPLVERIVLNQKPAFTTWELDFGAAG
ncbi:MAG: phage tail protein [Chloroflexota bacterium]